MNKVLVCALVGVPGALLAWLFLDWWVALPEGRTAGYVGRDSCVRCHADQNRDWTGSDHDLAMDVATPEFVLGDFDDTQLEHHGVTSKMSRRGDQFFVETEGPDGNRTEFEVKYTFGVRPLQQYLAETSGGKLQVLPVTWDTEEKRWFYAIPDAPFGPDDPLHWTGSAQNWNHMCADCHTTNFAKNYDLATHTHHHSYAEGDVSCEACHGPGSLHVELADSGSVFWDRRYGTGLAKLKGKDATAELESCAPCHSRRRWIYPDYKAGDRFLDHFSLSLLEDHLYHPDGQIDEEVYVYGSFLQSLMYRKGVRCTDCHDPHTAQVKSAGNSLCTQCHNPALFDTIKHHHHELGSKGAMCVECHMPEKNFMVVDPRRDHSIRVPRPDLTVSIGTPNACNKCHDKPDETAEWAAKKVVEWYGPKRKDDPHYGEAIHAGRQGRPSAEPRLIDVIESDDVGPIVRATAVSLLATRYQTQRSQKRVFDALEDSDPLVRATATRYFDGRRYESQAERDQARGRLVPLLTDPIRLVRTEAARLLPATGIENLKPREAKAFNKALEEYTSGLLANADQSGTHMSLGILYDQLGRTDESIDEYRVAIRLEPTIAGPRSNLAQLLDRIGDSDEATRLREEEAELLTRDAELLPDNAPIHYRLGLTLYVLGREQEAAHVLARACNLAPTSTEYLMMLTLLYEKLQQWHLAVPAAERLVKLQPNNPMFHQILQKIQFAASNPSPSSDAQAPPPQ